MSFLTPFRSRRLQACLLALAAGAAALPAGATLGGDAASVEADRIALQATALPAVAGAGYSVAAFTLPSGTVVREFVAPAGTVFGVAWEGPLIPDLKQLLGATHFAAVGESTRNRNREGRRGPMALRPAGDAGLVMESSGHMRAFAGRAWLAPQLPAGVDADAVR